MPPGVGGIKAGKAFVIIEAIDATAPGLAKIGAKFQRWGQKMAAMGSRAVLTGMMAMMPQFFSSKIFMEFDTIMRQVEARSEGTADEMKVLAKQARQLGRDTTTSAVAVGQLMGMLAQKGFDRASMKEMVPAIRDLAEAGSEGGIQDTALAADLVTAALKMFNLEASDTRRVVDVMTASVNASGATMEDMAVALSYAGRISQTFGATLEDTVSAIGMLRDVRMEPGTIGTAIRNMYLEMSNVDKVAKFNEKFKAATGQIFEFRNAADGIRKPIAQILFEIGELTKGMGPMARADLFFELFGKRAIIPAMELSQGKNPFENISRQVEAAHGQDLAAKTAKIMGSGTGGAWKRFIGIVSDLGIEIGDALAPALIKLIEVMRPVIDGVIKWVSENKGLIVSITAATIAFMAWGVALFVGGKALSVVGTTLKMFSGILGFVKTMVTVLGPIIGFLFTPFGAGVVILAALTAAFFKFTDVGRNALTTIANLFTEKFAGIGEIVETTWAGVMKALSFGDFAAAWEIAVLGMQIAWDKFCLNTMSLWKPVLSFFYTGWETAVAGFMAGISGIHQAFMSLPEWFFQAIGKIFRYADKFGKFLGNWLFEITGGLMGHQNQGSSMLSRIADELEATVGKKHPEEWARDRELIMNKARQNIDDFQRGMDTIGTDMAKKQKMQQDVIDRVGETTYGYDPGAPPPKQPSGNPSDYPISKPVKLLGTAMKGLQQGTMEAAEAFYKNKEEQADKSMEEDALEAAEAAAEDLAEINVKIGQLVLGTV